MNHSCDLVHEDIINLGERPYFIRLYVPTDQEQVVKNVNQVIAEGSFLLVEQFTFTEDWLLCLNSKNISRDKSKYILAVAIYDDRVVGHCRVFPVRDTSKLPVGEMGFLVTNGHCKIGLGTALGSFVMDHAKKLDYKKIILYTASANRPALFLARKLGFIEEFRSVNHYFLQDRYMDEVLLSRNI